MPRKTVLHVGCGQKTLAQLPPAFRDGSWTEIRLDIDEEVAPDVVGTITDMKAIESGSVDAVFSSHSIEHVYWHEVPLVVREFERVLSPAGFALVTCPNLQSLAQVLAEGDVVEPLYESPSGPVSALDIMYGHLASVAAGQHHMAHKCGFTGRTLQKVLHSGAFKRVVVVSAKHDLWAVAAKGNMTVVEFRALFTKFIPIPIAGS
jgi:predicted SAM-dependent methyltransferase